MKAVFQEWRDKLFRFTHALILPLSTLVIASLIVGISNIFLVSNIKHQIIISLNDIGQLMIDYMPILFGAALVFYFVKLNKVYALFAYIIALGIFFGTQGALIKIDEKNNVFDVFNLHNHEYFRYFVTQYFKFSVLNTSYFGAFIIATTTIWIINHCSDFELNKWFSLIKKEKFVPIILIPVILVISILMVVIWPYIGQGLSLLLIKTTNLSYGFDMFFYGVISAILKPLGFHYVFSSLVLETSIGGVLSARNFQIIAKQLDILHLNETKEIFILLSKISKGQIFGQKNILNFINELSFNRLPINNQGDNLPILNWFNNYLNISIGEFTQNYSVTFGVYLGITTGIIIFSTKEKRKQLVLIFVPSLLVTLLTGISEPFIFILLFASPLLYFVLYIPLTGFSLMFMKLFDAHILGNINHGLIDFISYGIIPFAKGTKFWIVFPISIIQGIISFAVTYLYAKKFNWQKIFHTEYNAIYISKKQYKNLLSVGFYNNYNSNKNDLSIKKQIQNYIIENIKNQKWKIGDSLPSEKALSIKFNCSRLTSRNALLKYVDSGILSVKKGHGYFVDKNFSNIFIDTNNEIADYQNQMLKTLTIDNIYFNPNWLNYEYDFKKLNLNKTHNIEKKYFDQKNILMIYEIVILNRNEILLVNNATVIDNELLKHLNLQHKDLIKNYSRVIFTNNQKYQNIAKELGWQQEYPLIVSLLKNENNWIEISLKIIAKNNWEFSRDYKIIN